MLKGHLSVETAVEILKGVLEGHHLWATIEHDERGYIFIEMPGRVPEIAARIVGQRIEMAVQWHGFATGQTYSHYYSLVKAVEAASYTVPALVTGPDAPLNPHVAGQWLIENLATLQDQAADIQLAYAQLQRREYHRRVREDKKVRRLANATGLNYGSRI